MSRARSTEWRSGSPGQPGRGSGVHGVVDRAHQCGFLVPNRRQVDLAHPGGAEQQHGAAVCDGAQRLGYGLRRTDGFDDVGESAHEHEVLLVADHSCAR